MTNQERDKGPYNCSIWRIQNGKPLSVQAGRFVNGKIIASAGKWTGDNGLPAYHDAFVAEARTFCGEPCTIVVTATTSGVLDACRLSHEKAYHAAARNIVQIFGAVNLPGLVQVDAVYPATSMG